MTHEEKLDKLLAYCIWRIDNPDYEIELKKVCKEITGSEDTGGMLFRKYSGYLKERGFANGEWSAPIGMLAGQLFIGFVEEARIKKEEKEMQNKLIESSIRSAQAVIAGEANQIEANKNQREANSNQIDANKNQRSANRNTVIIGVVTVLVAAVAVWISFLTYKKNDDRLNIHPLLENQMKMQEQMNKSHKSLDSAIVLLSNYRDSIRVLKKNSLKMTVKTKK